MPSFEHFIRSGGGKIRSLAIYLEMGARFLDAVQRGGAHAACAE
jgi:hypothetical protein